VGHQQHFARAGDCFAVGVPEADQAERTEADHFPAEIEDKEIGAEDETDEAADEDQHGAVEARGSLVVGHVSDGVEQHQPANACAHESEENAEGVDVENERERAIPRAHLHIDRLDGPHGGNQTRSGGQGRQTSEEGEYSLRSSGAESRYQNLQHCAQQKRAWSNQNESRGCHALMLRACGINVM
jgi:hypothetical protein